LRALISNVVENAEETLSKDKIKKNKPK